MKKYQIMCKKNIHVYPITWAGADVMRKNINKYQIMCKKYTRLSNYMGGCRCIALPVLTDSPAVQLLQEAPMRRTWFLIIKGKFDKVQSDELCICNRVMVTSTKSEQLTSIMGDIHYIRSEEYLDVSVCEWMT